MICYKYKYADLECEFCADKKAGGHPAGLCRHIMENITDFLDDDNFCGAIREAESCCTRQRRTLIYLKNYGIEKMHIRLYGDESGESSPHCSYREECEFCRYAGHGFICYNEHNKTCLRD